MYSYDVYLNIIKSYKCKNQITFTSPVIAVDNYFRGAFAVAMDAHPLVSPGTP